MRNIILLSMVIVITAAFFASTHPDGLEKVAQNLGFIEKGVERTALMTGYKIPFVGQEGISSSIAGVLGVFIILGLFWSVAAVFNRHNRH